MVATSDTVCLALHRTKLAAVLGNRSDVLRRQAARRTWEAEHVREKAIQLCELRTLSTLGVGAFGRVKLVVHTPTETPFAMKCLCKGQVLQYNQQDHVVNEKSILAMCSHPFLPRLAATFQDETELYMLQVTARNGR